MLPSFRKIVLSLFSTLFILSSIAVTVVITNDKLQKQVMESFAKTTTGCAGLGSPKARKECEASNEASADTVVNQAYRNAHPKLYPAVDSTGRHLSNAQQIDILAKFADGDTNPKVAMDVKNVCTSLNLDCKDLDSFVLTKIKTFTKDKDTIAEFTQKIAAKKVADAIKANQIALIEKNKQIAATKLQESKNARIDAEQAAAREAAARAAIIDDRQEAVQESKEIAAIPKPQSQPQTAVEPKGFLATFTDAFNNSDMKFGSGGLAGGNNLIVPSQETVKKQQETVVNNYAACNGNATCNKAMTVVDNTVVSDTYKNYWQGQNAKSEGGANLNGLAATMFSYTPIGYTAGLLGYKSKAAEDYKKIALNSGTTLDTIDAVTLKTFKPYVANYQRIDQQNGGGASLTGLAGFTTNLIDRSGTLTDSLGLTNAANQYTKLITKGATDKETLSATTKLGTVITLEGYTLAVGGPQAIAATANTGILGGGAALLSQAQVVSTVYQAGDAASYCTANGWDLSCQKATGRTMLNFATLGTSQFASKSLSLGTKLLNTGVSATNLGIDSVDAVQIFQDKNSNGLSKAMAIAALAGDVGGGIADFNRGELGFSRPVTTTSESLTNALTAKVADNIDLHKLEGSLDAPVAPIVDVPVVDAPVAVVVPETKNIIQKSLDGLANKVDITPTLDNLDAPAPIRNTLTEVKNSVTDWLSAERAKINPDAFANTGRDLSNAVENAKVSINRTVEGIANGTFADKLFGRTSIGDTDIAATYHPVGDMDIEGSVVRVKTDGTVELQTNLLGDNSFKSIKDGDRVFGDGSVVVINGKYYAFFDSGSLGLKPGDVKLDESGFRVIALTEGQQSKSILELLGLDRTNQLAIEKSMISMQGKNVTTTDEVVKSLLEEGYKPQDINMSVVDDFRQKVYDDKLAKSRPPAPVDLSNGNGASSVSDSYNSLYRIPDPQVNKASEMLFAPLDGAVKNIPDNLPALKSVATAGLDAAKITSKLKISSLAIIPIGIYEYFAPEDYKLSRVPTNIYEFTVNMYQGIQGNFKKYSEQMKSSTSSTNLSMQNSKPAANPVNPAIPPSQATAVEKEKANEKPNSSMLPYNGFISVTDVPDKFQEVAYLSEIFNVTLKELGMPKTDSQKKEFVAKILEKLRNSGNDKFIAIGNDSEFENYLNGRVNGQLLGFHDSWAGKDQLIQCNLWAIGVSTLYPELHIVSDEYGFENGGAFYLADKLALNRYTTADGCYSDMETAILPTSTKCTGKELQYNVKDNITAYRFTEYSKINAGDSFTYGKHFGVILEKYIIDGKYWFLVTEANSPKSSPDGKPIGQPQTYLVSQDDFPKRVNDLSKTFFLRLNKYNQGTTLGSTPSQGIIDTIKNTYYLPPPPKPEPPVIPVNTRNESIQGATYIETASGNKFLYWNQADFGQYGIRGTNFNLSNRGCGIMTGAMVAGMTPDEYYKYFLSTGHNFVIDDKGTKDKKDDIVGTNTKDHIEVLESMGYTIIPIKSKAEAKAYTDAGNAVWADSTMDVGGKAVGHIAEVIGVDENNNFIINDPAGWPNRHITDHKIGVDAGLTLYAVIPPTK